MKIPHIAILSVTTTAACADPLIGDWDLNEVCISGDGEEECQSFPQSYDGGSASLVMTVEDDWTGEMNQVITGEYAATYTFPLTAEKEAANTYKIIVDVPDTTINFDCNLDSTALDCEASMSGMSANYKFTKK